MTEKPTVWGLSFKVFTDPHKYPELREVIEKQGREAFTHKYGFKSTDQQWLYEAAHVWEDENTGEVFDMPEMWMLVVEGVKP